ncbi:AraC family transcriptional regulator [Rhizobium leguminosarum bv. viciae]|uniref:AraC family transcriptional regulator n=1 Tax=Rhizobium leguminosarum bv. viciae TaxID=387 RepID=A0A8I2GKM2_RHILV|nr:AraC family transcriptional regulator [Rhizobium leguminosarum]MBY5791629.1 AraC family transcriptional regulator [Rhizobium leguminosarum]NKM43581.1 AraC family transcriptional regulator [Rhizobium leguminosarum bv. viciae]
MNPFDEIIHQMQVETSLYARLNLTAPWGVRFHTGEHARLVVISGSDCWFRWDGIADSVRLESGACMIVQPHVTFDLLDLPNQNVIACETLVTPETVGAVAYGGRGAQTEIASARFSFDAVAAEPLFRSIPALVHFPLNETHAALITATLDLIGMETNAGEHGSGFVVDRLVNTLFVQALRALCSNDTGKTSCWLAGLGDRRLARAIHAVHSDLARRWTVEDMAQEAGLSRSSFAALFKSVVGEAPLDYLTGWRVYRVKMLLTATDESLLRIANMVGYDNDLSLSRVFKRRTGIAPGKWRQMMKQKGSVQRESAPVGSELDVA